MELRPVPFTVSKPLFMIELPGSSPREKPKVAVVLGSGGLKPVSALPLLEFLKEESIDIDIMVGASGGAIMGGLWNLGYDTTEIVEITQRFLSMNIFTNLNYKTVLSIARMPFGRFDITSGLLKNKIPLEYCREVFKGIQIEDLPIPMYLQTTDIQTGKGVVLEKGPLGEAVYASSAIYPLAPPYNWEGKWLVDGAFSAPLPILEAVKHGADVIIALVFNEKLVAEPKHFMDGFNNTIRAFSNSLVRSQLLLAIDLHHFEIVVVEVPFDTPISMSDPVQIPKLLDLGRKAIEKNKVEIIHAVNNFQP